MSEEKINIQPNKFVKSAKNIYTKNRKTLLILAIVIVIAIIAITAYSLFSDTKQGKTDPTIGKIEVILKEDWPNPGETVENGGSTETYDQFGIKKYSKKVWGESTGDVDSYVRIRCIPVVEYFVPDESTEGVPSETSGKWITTPVSQEDVVVAINPSNENNEDMWIKDGDYWYYKNILPAGESTAPIAIDWQVASVPPEISTSKIRADVRVVLEYAQSSHDMWKSIFQITNLPQGVQTLEGGE